MIAGILASRPDVLLLTRIDHDLDGIALAALAGRLTALGVDYPHRYAPRQNRGQPSGRDLDGNGRLGDPDDAHGYGRFSGDGAMALLSRVPIAAGRDFSQLLWRELPGARLGGIAPEAQDTHRLSSSAHWELQLQLPDGQLTLLTWAATPPLFSPTSRNPDRNHDEAAFWLHRLAGAFGPPPALPFVLIGLANLAPDQGDPAALNALIAHPALQPPAHGDTAQLRQGPARLSHIQPSADLRVTATGLWPPPGQDASAPGGHRLVWIDLDLAARP